MFESDESKNNTRATTKARKPIAALISVLISVTSVLISLSVVKTGDAAPIVYDKSGMDILCTQPGDVYSGCVNGQSICFGGDGKNIICDCKTGNCTTFTSTGKSNPNGTAINDLVTLKELQIIDGKLNNLTTKINNLASQQSALISGQNALANQVNGLDLACTTSDLVPLPSSTPTRGPGDFCRRDDQGRLLVRVHNQGGIDAGASTTRVAFGCANPSLCSSPTQVDVATPVLPAFTGTDLVPIPIPTGCFDPTTLNCEFKIGVDIGAAVIESNEANNNAAGTCGPQFL